VGRSSEEKGSGTPNKYEKKVELQKCVFWSEMEQRWSAEGCCLERRATSPSGTTECHCNHLTNFALLVKNDIKLSTPDLSLASDIGCYLSIACLILTVITYITNKKAMRMRATKIFLNAIVNMKISLIIFIFGVGKTQSKEGCLVTTLLLHYFLLATWCWKTAYSYEVYLSLVKVFNISREKYLQKLAVICYVIPFLIVGLTSCISIGVVDYKTARRYCDGHLLEESSYMANHMCWLHGDSLIYGFLMPVAVMITINSICFLIVMVELHKKKTSSSGDCRVVTENLMLSITMALTMGVAWVSAYLVVMSNSEEMFLVTSWLFAILCAFQGVLIFLFSVVRRQHLWMHYFENCGIRTKFFELKAFNSSRSVSQSPTTEIQVRSSSICCPPSLRRTKQPT